LPWNREFSKFAGDLGLKGKPWTAEEEQKLRELLLDNKGVRYIARQLVREQAFFDRCKGESVCLATVDDVAFHLALKFGEPVPEDAPNVERGLVLSNQRGEGAFQPIEM
jgi:hypothetical protein